MGFWTDKMFVEWKRVESLSALKSSMFVAACVHHAFIKNEQDYRIEVDKVKVDIVAHAINSLWDCINGSLSSQQLRNEAEAVVTIRPSEDSPDYFVFGWDYLLFAVINALSCIAGENPQQNAIYAVRGAYQSIADSVMNEALFERGGMDGDQVAEVEALSPCCKQEVEFQLRCLQQVEFGHGISQVDIVP